MSVDTFLRGRNALTRAEIEAVERESNPRAQFGKLILPYPSLASMQVQDHPNGT